MQQETIRHRVEVRPHPTVVRLEHLREADNRWIRENYHITEAVQAHLDALRHVLAMDHGRGVFVIGPYGSGKTHFLAYLIQGLREGEWLEAPPQPVHISLVNYSGTTALEAVVAEALGLEQAGLDRRPAWQGYLEQHPDGVLLVLYELSEFLRSKPDAHSFTEDVRFLQFLGEWTQGARLWVLAALQEGIEHTGELEHALYRKIKDRYPLRLLLTPTHIRELISDSLLVKKPGYDEAVARLVQRLEAAFPGEDVDLAALAAIYPLHPATLELLETVRDRFSQARGIVEFTLTQLAGSTERDIEPFLDQPWGALLTPDRIVDHFQDLFEVQPEFLPLAQQLLPHYRRHMAELFPRESQRALAWRLLKLLMVAYLAPDREGLGADEATAWLAFAATRLDPAKNREIIAGVLEQLADAGRYVRAADGRYALDLRGDGGAGLERLLERELAALPGDAETLLEGLAGELDRDAAGPLALPRGEWTPRIRRWHFHERRWAFFVGEGEPPPPPEAVALVIRLPWGERTAVARGHTLIPEAVAVTPELRELAALARLEGRPLAPEARRQLQRRLERRQGALRTALEQAYREARLVDPEGRPERAPACDTRRGTEAWLGCLAERLLHRTYPGFERFAPGHGPLPREAYRRFMRACLEQDLAEYEADEYVKLIREAYLVPMGLLRRSGRDYATPARLDRHELVQLVLPLLEHRPAPATVVEHLAEPIHGLVADQTALLLIFLMLQGVLDIRKGGRSYREHYETLPNPIQYDEVVPGDALDGAHTRALETLCDAFRVQRPKQWSVLTQRRAVRQVVEAGRADLERLKGLLGRLRREGQAEAVAARIETLLGQWAALAGAADELDGLRQFLYEAGRAERFVEQLARLRDLPERLEGLRRERGRLHHLLGQLAPYMVETAGLDTRIEALGEAPGLDDPDGLEQWLEAARGLYGEYREAYHTAHDAWWQALADHPVWDWHPPAIAASRHAGLQEALAALEAARREAQRLRCRRLADLDFQARCDCGFEGEQAAAAVPAAEFERRRAEVEAGLRRFFGQAAVRARLREWADQGLEVSAGMRDYLAERAPWPEVPDLEALDRHLAGIDLVREVDSGAVLDLLTERTWDRAALLQALDHELAGHGDVRLRFTAAATGLPPEVTAWCLEQALRHGSPLPDALAGAVRNGGAELACPEWVAPAALERLERLGLGEAVEDRVLAWLRQGEVAAPARPSPLVAAARALDETPEAADPEALGRAALRLFRYQRRLQRLDPQACQAALARVAETTPAEAPPPLEERLRAHEGDQWLLVDALGIPLWLALAEGIEAMLPAWRHQWTAYATAPDDTTDGCYQALVAAGFNHPMEKVNAVDRLLHERTDPFDDLCALAADGSYIHGSGSALERLVPVVRFAPRG